MTQHNYNKLMTEPNDRGVSRPYILISNDDGYKAAGINTLIDTLHPTCSLSLPAADVRAMDAPSLRPLPYTTVWCIAKKDWKSSLVPAVPSTV